MQQNKVDRSAFKKRIIAHRMRIFVIAAICLMAVAVIVFMCYNAHVTRSYTSYNIVNEVERTAAASSQIKEFGSRFITYSADGIHCTDAKGKDVWSFSFEMQDIMLDVNGDYVACADYNGREIYVFGAEGRLGTVKTDAPVKKICVSATGVVAAVTDNGSVTPIQLYYYDGTEIAAFRTTMSKSGYPVALGISDDSKLVGVSYLYIDSGTVTSKVAFYNFGEVGQNETDNLVSGYDFKDEIIPTLHFLGSKKAFALANDKLIFFEGKERPTNSANILLQDEVQAVFYGDSRVGLLFINETGETKYKMEIYTAEGKLENTITFDMEYQDIFFANNCVIIYNAAGALIYTDSGYERYSGEFEDKVLLMLPTGSELRYTIVTEDSIKTISLSK